jgi:hypothetical protein
VTNIAIVNKETHRNLRVLPAGGDEKNFVAVIVNEFSHLVLHYPILFSKDTETGAFYCGAMLGIDTGENLFRDEGLNVYRPLNLQRGPFYTHGDELAVDLDHPRIGAAGQPLFTEAGEPTVFLQSILALFRDLVPGMERTKAFISTLLTLKLIQPVDIELAFDDGTKRSLQGLYTIDTEALRNLPDAAALDLFRRGYLQLIYLMVASMKQVPVLARKKNNLLSKDSAALSGALG